MLTGKLNEEWGGCEIIGLFLKFFCVSKTVSKLTFFFLTCWWSHLGSARTGRIEHWLQLTHISHWEYVCREGTDVTSHSETLKGKWLNKNSGQQGNQHDPLRPLSQLPVSHIPASSCAPRPSVIQSHQSELSALLLWRTLVPSLPPDSSLLLHEPSGVQHVLSGS